MHNSDLITPQHLARKAVIYIRPSTPHQVVSHQESLRLQDALHERARQLGWPDEAIDIIDDDLGLTAASAAHREGFNTLIAQVTLEQVGLIVSYDVTRLSRNCSDWYPLLDLCGYKGCLIADGDGIYDPATVNGRLLLGLKGTLSEWERHTMKARLTAGLIHKAQRGELALTLPTRLVRNGQGKVLKIPNQEAQARLALVFETFLQCRSASRVVDEFNRHGLLLPRRDQIHTSIVWRGGETTTMEVSVAVGALTDLPTAPQMAQQIRVLFAEGKSDNEMARQLTQQGYRSPSQPTVLPSTVKGTRLKLGLMQQRSQSHPRRIAGYLTVPQLAKELVVTPHWVYHQIKRGTIPITRDTATGLYLFPDTPETLEALRQLQAGQRTAVRA